MPRATPSPDAHKFVHIDVDSFLRNLEQLTQGDDPQKDGEDGESANALLSAVERRLQGADSFDIDDIVQKLDEFENHDIISRILDQGHSDANALGITVTEHKRDVEANLNKVEMASIEDYITESPNLIQLQHEIEDCDSMLAHIERLLSSFLGNLGSISEQITQLQSNSQDLKLKLENRQAAEGLIGALLERLVVPDSLVNSVFEAPVDEAFVPVLEELMKRLEASESVQLEMPGTPALKEVKPVLEKLRVKAAERVRKAMMEQIYSLRQPRTNIQMKQANVLFKSAGMVAFLKKCGPEVYTEVRDAYVATLSRALSVGFRQYLSGIKSLHKEVATKDDVLGAKVGTGGEGGGVGMLSVLKGVRPRRKGGLYGLGNRVQVLLPERDDNGRPKERRGIIMAHVPRGQTFSYEWIFFSVQNFLVSTSISEYAFDLHLFKDAEVFSSIMHPILQFIEANMATEVDELHDIVGVLLCLRVHHQNRLTLTKHAMPALEGYQDRVAMKLWERFQALLERHSRSIRPPAEKALFRAVLAPHRVAEDCSDLIVSLLQLNHEYSDSYIREAVERLARDLVQLLLRLAPMFRDSKQSTVFLIINYFAVLSRLQSGDRQVLATLPSTPPHSSRSSSERGGMGSIGTSILQEFSEHYARSARMYVDLALASHFRELMEFVGAAERTLRSCEDGQLPGPLVEQATGVMAQFRSQWEHDLSGLCERVRSSFQVGGTDCARDILQRCLTQLMLTYQRAQDVLRAHGPGAEEVLRNAVPVQAVMYHIKQLDKSL